MSRKRNKGAVDFRVDKKDVDIVIPVFGNFDTVKANIDAINKNTHNIKFNIYLVDDASPDYNPTGREFYDRIKDTANVTKIIRHTKNTGFPQTVNDGVKAGDSKYVLILNSDVILQEGALDILHVQLENNPDIGITFPKLIFFPNSTDPGRPGGKVQHAGMVFDIQGRPYHIYSGWNPEHPMVNVVRDMNCCTGACMLIRRSLFEDAGGFDPIYERGCLIGNSYVFTNSGLLRIDEMTKDHFIDYTIVSLGGNRKTNLSFINGIDKTYKAVLEKRFEIRATPDHKIWTMGVDGVPDWKEISKLTTDDFVGIKKNSRLFGNNHLDNDEAYLLGLFISEGCLDGRRICITNGDVEIENFLFAKGFVKNRKYHYRFNSKSLKERFEFLNVDLSKKASEKVIPDYILQADFETQKNFLSGLFDGDGSANKNNGKVTLTSTSFELLKQVQLLLLNIGIVAGISHKWDAQKRLVEKILSSCKESWTLELSNGSDIFYNEIGFRLDRKQQNYKYWRGENNFDFPYQKQWMKRLYFSLGDKRKYETYTKFTLGSSNPNTSRNSIVLFLSSLDDDIVYSIEKDHLLSLIESDIIWLRVRDVSKCDDAMTYDIHVPETHAYTANGIMVHNTWEDVELCLRVRQMNYKVRYLPQSVGWHYTGMSAEKSGGFPVNRNASIFRARWGDNLPFDEFLYSGF